MHTDMSGDMDRQIHDSVFINSIDRIDRIKKYVSRTFGVKEEYLKEEADLNEILNQLERENNPLLEELDEEVWLFRAEQDMGESTIPANRTANKNSFYNRSKAKDYIDKYWKNYNPAYPSFHGGGGDCANFVSQVLFAGGMPWVDDRNPAHYTWFTNWYCKPGASNKDGDRRITLSWKVAAAFKRHWETRAARQIIVRYKDAIENMKQLSREVYVGDAVQFCYANGTPYHTLAVTGYAWDTAAGVNDIVLASHTMDSNKRSLYNTMLNYPKDYQLRIYVMKESE